MDSLRPRLWWCPTGPFAELPLHAAGAFLGPIQDSLTHYVVSSYTPTMTALISAQAQDPHSRLFHESEKTLIVCQSDVEDLASLPNTSVEAAVVQRFLPPESVTIIAEKEASVKGALSRLTEASVLHLACHGHQDPEDPLMSGFSLQDGRLTLAQLMDVHMPQAQLAYLSACETAGTDDNQPDEAMNLAATMLFVGFKSVIATMWYVSGNIFCDPII
jgi:CHAT domain-containing protein